MRAQLVCEAECAVRHERVQFHGSDGVYARLIQTRAHPCWTQLYPKDRAGEGQADGYVDVQAEDEDEDEEYDEYEDDRNWPNKVSRRTTTNHSATTQRSSPFNSLTCRNYPLHVPVHDRLAFAPSQ